MTLLFLDISGFVTLQIFFDVSDFVTDLVTDLVPGFMTSFFYKVDDSFCDRF